jgi:methyl-accepting chemotaxis protein
VRNAHFARRLQLEFGVPIAVLLALSIVCYRSLVASSTGGDWLRHTHQSIERLAGLLSATQDIENGYRGFVITGDDQFLGPYQAGLA